MPVSCADGTFTGQMRCRGRPSADRQEQRPLIEALTEPVTGFADAHRRDQHQAERDLRRKDRRIRKVSLDGILSGSTAPAIWSSR
jgi:hypothetical protein